MALATPAHAGGSWLYPVQDRLEPGDTATFVGYVGPGQLGWVDDGPFFAFLRVDPQPVDNNAGFPFLQESDLPLGQLAITDWGERGYLSLRIAITFEIPADLRADEYQLVYCNDPCTEGIGDLIGAVVYVGIDNEFGAECRPWSFDEPEIANLASDARVCGVGGEATAAEILAGEATMNEYGEVQRDSDTTLAPEAGTESELDLERQLELQQFREELEQRIAENPLLTSYLVNEAMREPLVVLREDDGISPAVLTAVVLAVTTAGILAVSVVRRRRQQSE